MTDNSSLTFTNLGIAPNLLAILERLNFKVPTPIQHQSIPVAVEGKDIIGIAQTGTGKTLAFGIPMIQRLDAFKGRGLILLPTRELALQVDSVLQKFGRPLGLSGAVLIGGASMYRQVEDLRRQPTVIIATPGRLIDHLQQGTVKLNEIKILVLDEADRMLDMGFAPQINQILRTVPKKRQTLLFSATMPSAIAQIAAAHMALPVRIEVAPTGTSAEKVEQEIILVGKEAKSALLETLLQDCKGAVLVFSRTKHGARKICKNLCRSGHRAAEIHSDRSLGQRREALDGFKAGKYRVLVATDIAARGIDVSNIELVVNFDLPDNSEDYVHRIGRTGRAGKSGKAISFATQDQRGDIRAIERLIRKTLKILPMPKLANLPAGSVPLDFSDGPDERPQRSFQRRPQQGRRPFPQQGQRSRPQSQGSRPPSNSSFGAPNSPGSPRPRADSRPMPSRGGMRWGKKKLQSW
jgi:ATP-dependent RNA helicase RhlE